MRSFTSYLKKVIDYVTGVTCNVLPPTLLKSNWSPAAAQNKIVLFIYLLL